MITRDLNHSYLIHYISSGTSSRTLNYLWDDAESHIPIRGPYILSAMYDILLKTSQERLLIYPSVQRFSRRLTLRFSYLWSPLTAEESSHVKSGHTFLYSTLDNWTQTLFFGILIHIYILSFNPKQAWNVISMQKRVTENESERKIWV